MGRSQGYQSALRTIDRSLEKFGFGEKRFAFTLLVLLLLSAMNAG